MCAILVMCLVVNSLDALPVRKEADVEEYRLRIQESGTEFNETVTIDENEQTELFRVPTHNDVEKSDIMFDFKKNATVIHFPLKSVCFLLPLARDQPTPKNLVRNLQEVAVNNVVTTQKETVMVDEEITDRSMLSNGTASLCSRSRIFRVAQLPSGQIKVTKKNPHERRNRQSGIQTLCNDAWNLQDAVNNCPRRDGLFPSYTTKCRVEVESCAWLVDCPELGGTIFRGGQSYNRAQNFRLSVENDRKVTCGMNHRNWAFVCCGYYCD